ncbi:MAG: hypothetical protein HY244_09560, partial [Rhizobiales bacterium]|nr:hypothetical protein [Hyphomicrobiales bacterium]
MPKSLERKARVRIDLGPSIETYIDNKFKELGEFEKPGTPAVSPRGYWLEFLLMLGAFLGGALAHFTFAVGTNVTVSGSW